VIGVSELVPALSAVLSVGALAIAYGSYRRSGRALRISEEDHRLRLIDRDARPRLGIEIGPHNVQADADGILRLGGTDAFIELEVRVTNGGEKPAGRTKVAAWVPAALDSQALKWIDAAGQNLEELSGRSAFDLGVKLPTGDGREFDSRRIDRILESVPLIGETLYLRVPCQVPRVGAWSMIPVRVHARTDGSDDADMTYPIRIVGTERVV
jgi:hypothetical protein